MRVEAREKQRVAVFAGDRLIADQVAWCDDRAGRGRGLMGRSAIGAREGLLMVLPPYQQGRRHLWVSIHMLFVPFPLAVAWLDRQGRIVHSLLARPWRPYYSSPHPAWYTLELHPARLDCLRPDTPIRWDSAGAGSGAGADIVPADVSGGI